jgi:hypothetical protein
MGVGRLIIVGIRTTLMAGATDSSVAAQRLKNKKHFEKPVVIAFTVREFLDGRQEIVIGH